MQLKWYFRGKFIPKCLYLKGGKLKISDVSFHFKKLEKNKQIKP